MRATHGLKACHVGQLAEGMNHNDGIGTVHMIRQLRRVKREGVGIDGRKFGLTPHAFHHVDQGVEAVAWEHDGIAGLDAESMECQVEGCPTRLNSDRVCGTKIAS